MSQDMEQHISQLNSRLGVSAQNQLNSTSSTTSASASNQQENFQ